MTDEHDDRTPGADVGASDDAETVDPAMVERIFSVLETAVEGPASLDSAELDRLLDVLEAAVVDSNGLDAAELDGLLTILEQMVSEGGTVGEREDVLSVLETAIVDPSRIGETTEGVFSVLEAALTDPEAVESGFDDLFSLLDVFGLDTVGLGRRPDSRRSRDRERDGDRSRGRRSDRSNGEGATDAFRIARIAAATTQRATQYSVRSGIRTGTRLVQAATTANSLADLLDDTRDITFGELRRLGVDVGDDDRDGADRSWRASRDDHDGSVTGADLRERGIDLLERSSAIDYRSEVHPAYPRVLDQLAPDEARILRLLATEGTQPAVTVRSRGWVPFTSELVAADLTMVGVGAGCRHDERVPIYLDNLERLGLIQRSPEPVEDLKRYQVLDAQPAVEEAVAESTRPRIVRRSVHLTSLGVDFCRTCFDLDVVEEQAPGGYDVPPESVGPPEGTFGDAGADE